MTAKPKSCPICGIVFRPAQQKRDASRNKYLTTCGYSVVRIWESDMSFELVKDVLIKYGAL